MIKGDDVKEAITIELLKVFDNVKIYKEGISNPAFPHFFIYQINVTDDEDRKNYHNFAYFMEVRYRVASDPTTVPNIQSQLDDVALKLIENFNIIAYNEDLIQCTNKNVEKEDCILHFFFTCNILTKYVSDTVLPKFGGININLGVKK